MGLGAGKATRSSVHGRTEGDGRRMTAPMEEGCVGAEGGC